ncbi:hypothetical protein CsSME_00042987 [Camellia sinensis var. sinensis]
MVCCVGLSKRGMFVFFFFLLNSVSHLQPEREREREHMVLMRTANQLPSKAKYYLDDPNEVITMREALAEESGPPPSTEAGTRSTL